MYAIEYSTKFKKDYKTCQKRHLDISSLQSIIVKLANAQTLDFNHFDHKLSGEYSDCRECHIKPDWLLIYKIDENQHVLSLVRTGTHFDLFK